MDNNRTEHGALPISGLKAKSAEVFEHLYRAYGSMIVGHVRKNSGSEEDAREIVQLTMVKLWKAVQDGRYEEQGKLGHFIFQLAANTWREELRRRRNNPSESLNDQAYELEDRQEESIHWAIVKDRRLDAIYNAMQELQEDCRQLIRMYHLDKVSLQEIAEAQTIDYNNLRKRIFDCRKKLKRIAMRLAGE